MSLTKSMLKTKSFILKTLQNLRSFLFGGYEKIPRTLVLNLNPLSCSSIGQRSHQLDHIYSQYTNQSVPDHNQDNSNCPIKQIIDIVPLAEALAPNIDVNHSSEVRTPSHESMANKQIGARQRTRVPASSNCPPRFQNGVSYMLAQKMKELEMMDLSDVDHSLDVEEALHYYSRLTCPVYVDIVNKFFMDMYAEFLLPQPSISTISSSSRRLGPLTF